MSLREEMVRGRPSAVELSPGVIGATPRERKWPSPMEAGEAVKVKS
jgi:hypothetical protein